MKVLILDGYVDEPTCLGVPPYVSTYVRYVAGSLVDAGIKPDDIDYITIDKLRENLNLKNYKGENYFEGFLSALKKSYIKDYDLIIVISGLTVPGRYLGFTPISYSELLALSKLKGPVKILGGPIRFGFAFKGGNLASDISELKYEFISLGDIEKDVQVALSYIRQKNFFKILKNYRTVDEIDKWTLLGSFILKKHPLYPLLVCEIETYRGCERKFHCSFCTEKLYGAPQHRSLEGILRELHILKEIGISHIRFGKHPNILGYLALEEEKNGFRKPNLKALKELFQKASLLNFDTLHIDNVNPGTIYHFPKESKEALSIIANYDTPGDVAAFGIESADERVILENNLKVYPDQALRAVEIVNEVGAFKLEKYGEYKLLPGLNFLIGLKGETRKTFKKNIKFLEEILKKDLLVRRVNIRQVMIFPGTTLYEEEIHPKTKYQNEFKHFKYWVRNVFDHYMLKKVYPKGTILKNLVVWEIKDNYSYAKGFGSYPITVKIPKKFPLYSQIDIFVVDHKERSLIGVPYPLNVNKEDFRILKVALGENLAKKIILNRPFKSREDFYKAINKKIYEDHIII